MNDLIKLISLDIDGTLIDNDLNISKRTLEVIHQLYNRGIYIVLATGRTFVSAKNIMKKLSMEIPIVAYNGGYIYMPEKGQIASEKIPIREAKEVMRFAERNQIYLKVYIDDVLYVKEEDKKTIEFSKNHGIQYKVVGKLSENIYEDVNMVVLIHEDKFSGEIHEDIKALNLSTTSSNPYALEFLPGEISKETGLKIVAKELGVEREDILAIGDGLNDLEMLQFAGHGIAMKNGDPNLLKQWNRISKYTNDEDGVYHILKEL